MANIDNIKLRTTPITGKIELVSVNAKNIITARRTLSEGRGKVIGEFICDKLNYYPAHSAIAKYSYKDTRVNAEEFIKYSKGKDIYGWHISDLKIYDNPRELGEFKTPDKPYHRIIERDGCLIFTDGYEIGKPLKRAPQSWQYVEEA